MEQIFERFNLETKKCLYCKKEAEIIWSIIAGKYVICYNCKDKIEGIKHGADGSIELIERED